jgi:mono/diheme cytochrome c family protein
MNSVRAVMVVAGMMLMGAFASVVAQQQPPAGAPGGAPGGGPGGNGPGGGGKGWTIPAGAAQEANPLQATPDVIDKGKKLFGDKCQKCHGTAGKGDGPDADPDSPPDDLSDSSRAARNPDGVMFYKIWNGRKSPKMPKFGDELSKEDVWAVIHYAKTLRK